MATGESSYSRVAIVLHWLMAVCILILIALGLVMTRLKLPFAQLYPLYALHKSVGITVLFLFGIRLIWRLMHRPPPLPRETPAIERRAAIVAHWLLYLFLFLLPLTGWILVSVSPRNIPTILYGLVHWPDLPEAIAPASEAATKFMAVVHDYLAYFLIGVVLLHAGAALRHYFVLGDDILQRMLPFLRRESPETERQDLPDGR